MGAKISTPQGIVMFYNTHVCFHSCMTKTVEEGRGGGREGGREGERGGREGGREGREREVIFSFIYRRILNTNIAKCLKSSN